MTMASGDDLEEFRKQWERELKHTRRRRDVRGSTSKSFTSPDSATSSRTASNEHSEDVNSASRNNIPLEFLENNDSNSTENYHPFVIVDNLLKNGHTSASNSTNKLLSDSGTERTKTAQTNLYFGNVTREKRLDRDSQGSIRPTSGSKRRKLSDIGKSLPEKAKHDDQTSVPSAAQPRLLDQLIADLDEITEIPFFDIDLPRELALKIFQHLGLVDLCRCSQVSRAWRSLADDELLWYRICADLGEHKQVTEGGNWKSHAELCVVRRRTLISNWKNRVGHLQQYQYIKGGILCHVSSGTGRLVAGYTNGQVKMWQLTSDEECVFQPSCTSLMIDEGQEEGTLPNLLVCTATSDRLTAAGYTQGIVDVWQNDGSTSPIHTLACTETVSHLVLSPDQCFLVVSYGPYVRADLAEKDVHLEQLEILDLNSQVKHVQLLKCPEPYQSVQYKSVISTRNVVWLHRAGQPPDTMAEIHNMIDAPITAMDVSSTTSQLAVGVSVHTGPQLACKVKLYSLEAGKLLTTLKGHTYFISCVSLARSPAHHLVTGCGDRKVRVYDLRCPSPVMTLVAHTQTVSQVQMDDWKVVSGGEDGLTCVWDQRMALKLWDWHNRHPVQHIEFEDNKLLVANVPVEKFPQTDEFETSLHKRYRGSIQLYDFLSDQSTQGVPENCLSNYDTVEGYDYNIRLTVPYDDV